MENLKPEISAETGAPFKKQHEASEDPYDDEFIDYLTAETPNVISVNDFENLRQDDVGSDISLRELSAYAGVSYLLNLSVLEQMEAVDAPQIFKDGANSNTKRSLVLARAELSQASRNIQTRRLSEQLSEQIPEDLSAKMKIEPNQHFLDVIPKIDDEILCEFLVWNKNRIKTLELKTAPKFEELKIEFTDRMTKAIRSQKLPLSLQQLNSRMKNITFMLADPLATDMESIGGQYDGFDRTIKVGANYIDQQDLKEVVFHELMHHISGQTAVKYINDTDTSIYRVDITRIGLKDPDNSQVCNQFRLKWLNEAVTEQLAQIFLSDELENFDFSQADGKDFFALRTGVYIGERIIAEQLLSHTNGMLRPLLAAYFEDSNPVKDKQHPKNDRFIKLLQDQVGQSLVHYVSDIGMINTQAELNLVQKTIPRKLLMHTIFGIY